MPTFSKLMATAASCLVMVNGSAIPLDTSPVTSLLDKRADLPICSDIDNNLPLCPDIDNMLVRGERFRVRCDTDTLGNGNRQEPVWSQNFDDCMKKCESVDYRRWCEFVSWAGNSNEPGNCYMKAGNGNGPGDSGSSYYVNDWRSSGVKLGIRR